MVFQYRMYRIHSALNTLSVTGLSKCVYFCHSVEHHHLLTDCFHCSLLIHEEPNLLYCHHIAVHSNLAVNSILDDRLLQQLTLQGLPCTTT